ncbi:hypothetical protein B0I35DRAFT_426003 [Stachybotrys elegans]|uniref:CR-type domain-containing protein n=1 Tax=Stachybotrys elegans TaxID=80388 RepID=A0A8K0SJQ9_9HYPO|nr:hypothetical protein B0I35DRAFT_440842 [Stachybotrys elegans]KAH7322562.1 hypothetical protein B0I35DRAFT_426003 [Stachybotrys elegans]
MTGTCPSCKGSGMRGDFICGRCNGSGEISVLSTQNPILQPVSAVAGYFHLSWLAYGLLTQEEDDKGQCI